MSILQSVKKSNSDDQKVSDTQIKIPIIEIEATLK